VTGGERQGIDATVDGGIAGRHPMTSDSRLAAIRAFGSVFRHEPGPPSRGSATSGTPAETQTVDWRRINDLRCGSSILLNGWNCESLTRYGLRAGSSGWTRNRWRRAEREVPRFPTDSPRATNGAEGEVSGSSGWTRTSNPPVNRRKTAILPPVAAVCAETPDRELDLINIGPINDLTDAAVSRPNPRLGVQQRARKGKVER
jgi:hypothetical protein